MLVADDDRSIRTVLTQALGRSGYQVRATGNATTLSSGVEEGEGDLVITDVVMPDENVLDVLPRIRKQRPELPVDRDERPEHAAHSRECGPGRRVRDVAKPFDLDDMTFAAERALTRPNDRGQQGAGSGLRDERLP